jgi:DNA polymerase III sliding clamp (beta) subunit (PCNA family)
MDFDDLDVKLGGPLSPAVFRPLNDESFLYLLLPLRG